MVTHPIRRLQKALARKAKREEKSLAEALEELAREHAQRLTGPSSNTGPALVKVAAAISHLSAAADLGGRLELRFGPKAAEPEQFAAEIPDVVPVVAFDEAIRDLEERDPLGAHDLQRSGLEVEDTYGAVMGPDGRPFYAHAFSAAKAIDADMARRVRDRLAEGFRSGEATGSTVERLIHEWDWPAAYAETVVRTTYNTATTAGRFREAARVQGAGIPVGFKFQTAGDSNVRSGRPQDNGENHAALDGLVARADDPIWRRWSPPGGFNCRCVATPVIGDEVPEWFVTVPAGAAFAPGFGSRPDLRAYG